MSRIAAVTGLASEAAVLRAAAERGGVELTVRPAGADPQRTSEVAAELLAQSPDLLVSFGLAGALSGALRSGDALLPEAVIDPEGTRRPVDARWHAAVAAACDRPPVSGDIAGADAAVTTPQAKLALGERTGAAAVDMESHIVARAVERAGVPWLVLRAVSDPANRAVPPALLDLVRPDGGVRWQGIPRALLHPLALRALARDSRTAHATLSALADALMRAPHHLRES
ncbi:Phosphorylase superfamily protein [Limimonas halophila]|uniref:Phosphorylase superfamily protein n=1 Tax=Limimonas halophila TaxID=1082479 RepID=A0A1G7P3K0_9PROT|nr:phosphorylase [Limimonas halophila]SDF80833.1 Phosphorylase superfamily protein [Limimonas halophila]